MNRKIIQARKALLWSQKKTAEYFGIPLRTWQHWENGTRQPAEWTEMLILKDLTNLQRVGECVEVDSSWLEDWQYEQIDFVKGAHWIMALNGREVTYLEEDNFENAYIVQCDPDCGWGSEDDIFKVTVEQVLPKLILKIQTTLKVSLDNTTNGRI